MSEQELIHRVLRGHAPAIDFINDLADISQIWDDLVDRDKPVGNDSINRVFLKLLSDLPRNPFYLQNLAELRPLIEMAIIDWMTANTFEQAGENLPLAWAFRSNLAAVLIGSAKIIGGLSHAIEVSPLIRRHVYDESLEEYEDVFRRSPGS